MTVILISIKLDDKKKIYTRNPIDGTKILIAIHCGHARIHTYQFIHARFAMTIAQQIFLYRMLSIKSNQISNNNNHNETGTSNNIQAEELFPIYESS